MSLRFVGLGVIARKLAGRLTFESRGERPYNEGDRQPSGLSIRGSPRSFAKSPPWRPVLFQIV